MAERETITWQCPYGVIETDESGMHMKRIIEKPWYQAWIENGAFVVERGTMENGAFVAEKKDAQD